MKNKLQRRGLSHLLKLQTFLVVKNIIPNLTKHNKIFLEEIICSMPKATIPCHSLKSMVKLFNSSSM